MTPERSTEELEYKSAHAQPEEKTPYTPRPKSHIILAWVLLAIVIVILIAILFAVENFFGKDVGR